MSNQLAGFYFSCTADKSANDYTIYVEEVPRDGQTVKLAARYKNSEPNNLYEMILDADDLEAFGQKCLDHARHMKARRAIIENSREERVV